MKNRFISEIAVQDIIDGARLAPSFISFSMVLHKYGTVLLHHEQI